ncbi:hypothetical protein FAM09_13735 [Niastella caeni]|uniref:Uncharacterized protein n=1 Tax=Niastella caeni TaxID=2569763 RepID=A0A4S8HVD5_9BACT|nr:hypothetical protein [Niastella caeni]THU39560.1 hypothetical protein FAM09_13735 [Niastella caeni]
MKLLINGDRLIKDVQQEFNRAYPFLKIEFLKNLDLQSGQKLSKNKIAHNYKFSDIKKPNIPEGEVVVEDMMTVSDLEKAFMDKFGLCTQLFRRYGNVWLESSMSDSWSLKQQNDLSREITTGRKPKDKDDDFDLNRDVD